VKQTANLNKSWKMTLAEVLFFSNVIDLFQCTDKRNTDRVANNFYLLVFK